MKKLVCINTNTNFKETIYDPFLVPFAEENPEVELVTITDDTMMKETRDNNGVTPGVYSRMYQYARIAEDMGADCIMSTCTSVNQATKHIRPMLKTPFFNIEEPTVEAAVDAALGMNKRIGIISTLSSSPAAIIRDIVPYAESMGETIETVTKIVEGAFEVLCGGDREKHDKMICDAVVDLSDKVDVIVFAQITMSLTQLPELGIPVYKIGSLGLEYAAKLMSL